MLISDFKVEYFSKKLLKSKFNSVKNIKFPILLVSSSNPLFDISFLKYSVKPFGIKKGSLRLQI